MNKEIKKIFIILALYSFAGGLFYYFQEFWMAENNLSAKTIGITLSLCSLITCSVIFLCSNLITPSKLKKVTQSFLIIKSVLLLLLFFLNGSNYSVLIKFITMVEYSVDTELLILFYPLIALINKSDKAYGLRDIIYQSFFYFGAFIVILTIGKTLFAIRLTHNIFLFFSALLSMISSLLLSYVKIPNVKEEKNNNDILIKLIKKVKKDKISKNFLVFSLCSSIAIYSLIGVFLTLLVKGLNYTENFASIFKLSSGIIGSLLAALILSKITFKNDYINIGIKYIGRILVCVIALVFPYKYTIMSAIVFCVLSFSWYTHVTDAPYINRFEKKEQLSFANLSEITVYFGKAIGTILCSALYVINIRFNLALSIVFYTAALLFAYRALNLRIKERE